MFKKSKSRESPFQIFHAASGFGELHEIWAPANLQWNSPRILCTPRTTNGGLICAYNSTREGASVHKTGDTEPNSNSRYPQRGCVVLWQSE